MKKYALGIDLGGTGTKFGLVNEEGQVLRSNSIPTQQYPDIDEYCDVLCAGLKQLVKDEGLTMADIVGVGCGAPNANFYSGCIEQAPNLPWKGVVPFAKLITERMGVKCTITNDANAAAQGEMIYGSARGLKNFIVITLGTGVGSGIVINGQLVYGCDGFAGELGHVTMVRGKEGRTCGCGRTGCLEAYCSATGVARTARELLAKTERPSLLREMNPEDITSLDVAIAAGKGDELAKEIYEFTGKMLGEACADFAAFSSPEAFIFFGGMVKAGDLIMEPIKKAYENHVMPIFKGKAQFLVSGLDGASAAVLGASAIGWEIQ